MPRRNRRQPANSGAPDRARRCRSARIVGRRSGGDMCGLTVLRRARKHTGATSPAIASRCVRRRSTRTCDPPGVGARVTKPRHTIAVRPIVRPHDRRCALLERSCERCIDVLDEEMHLRLVCGVVVTGLVQHHDRVANTDPCMTHATAVAAVLHQDVPVERIRHECDQSIGICNGEVRSDREVSRPHVSYRAAKLRRRRSSPRDTVRASRSTPCRSPTPTPGGHRCRQRCGAAWGH